MPGVKQQEGIIQIAGKKKSLARMLRIVSGRGGETRTRDTRFWRPVLYQLSYAPKFLTTKPANKAGLV